MAQWDHYDGQEQRTPSWLETIQDLPRPCTFCIPSQYHSDIRRWTCHDNASVFPSEEAVSTCKARCPWQFAVLAQQRRECHSTSYSTTAFDHSWKQGGLECFVILEILLVWFGFYVRIRRYVTCLLWGTLPPLRASQPTSLWCQPLAEICTELFGTGGAFLNKYSRPWDVEVCWNSWWSQ